MLILLIDCEKQLINGNLSSSSLQHSVNSTGIFFKGGEDLDTFTEPSTLNCNSYNVAQSLIHTPPIGTFGSGFRFDVFASSFGGRVQRIMVHDTIPKIFYRSKFSDTWNNWEKVVSNTDLNPEVYIVPKPSDTSTFTFSNRSFQVSVRKSGKVVTIQLNISGSMAAVSDFVTAFTIPQKYKPLTDIVINYVTQNTAKAITLFITQKGEVKFTNFNTSIDDWLCRQCITYVTDN